MIREMRRPAPLPPFAQARSPLSRTDSDCVRYLYTYFGHHSKTVVSEICIQFSDMLDRPPIDGEQLSPKIVEFLPAKPCSASHAAVSTQLWKSSLTPSQLIRKTHLVLPIKRKFSPKPDGVTIRCAAVVDNSGCGSHLGHEPRS